MTQTKSPAHTADCRKIADPSNCLCHVGAYTDQHPFICTQHTLGWHHKDRATCEEFETILNEACGFSSELDDEAAKESRKFKIGRDAEVLRLIADLRAERTKARWWQKASFTTAALALAGVIMNAVNIAGGF